MLYVSEKSTSRRLVLAGFGTSALRSKVRRMYHKSPLSLSRNGRRAGLRRRSGVAAVEAAMLLPVALILMLGSWEAGRMVEVTQILSNAAREGGRSASTGQNTNSQVQQTVSNYLKNAGLPSTLATVTVSDLTSPSTDCTAAKELDQLQVKVSIPLTAVRWSAATLITNSSTTLNATAIFYSNNGQSYPTNISVPQAY
jgi:Flp pilus assembly protein TadG